ncbi:hypothetical protein PTKIN_Ptkin09bG0142800 [Pterospermum kingtungense]
MSMTKNSSDSYSSVKRILVILGLLAMLVSTEFVAVHGRILRSTRDNVVVPGLEGQVGAENKPVGVPPITAASADNSSSRNSLKTLAFRLASGPSKRGPGH